VVRANSRSELPIEKNKLISAAYYYIQSVSNGTGRPLRRRRSFIIRWDEAPGIGENRGAKRTAAETIRDDGRRYRYELR